MVGLVRCGFQINKISSLGGFKSGLENVDFALTNSLREMPQPLKTNFGHHFGHPVV